MARQDAELKPKEPMEKLPVMRKGRNRAFFSPLLFWGLGYSNLRAWMRVIRACGLRSTKRPAHAIDLIERWHAVACETACKGSMDDPCERLESLCCV